VIAADAFGPTPMILDPAEIASFLPFEERYERRQQRWYDGPYGSWEAFDRVLERDVILNMARGYPEIPRVIRTAKIAASLQHPCFLPVYDLGIVDCTTPFYTTPPVRGEPLSDLLRNFEGDGDSTERPFPLRPIIEAVRDACRAMEYAHGRGLLHLDLYPGSLLIGEDYRILMDIHEWTGVGVRDEDREVPFGIVGRPVYMSPEQVNPAGPEVGPATDVFGIGGILHVILFGTPPNHLGRPSVEVIMAIAGRAFEPRRPGTLRPAIRSSEGRKKIDYLVGVCLKALAYEPERRFPTAAALGAALDEWLEPDRSSWWGAIRRRNGGV
jgi:eukaryotic-like serine/threonine-protein kinase